ncbi:flagellar filament capping protein FliD [Acetatifactor muris]|uniref:Flagellar capping protein n=1 Tax=Acetatifactor muris TaxID=879566 RepID=A0A2K4ZAM6_9FIRM|nr:flagellar filament capping protein FliD [Acetatifactor muris]MCR2048713.1 flagellar filament capping protein FliD [Acetatifactor muris]SOY27507.1 flagellar capping protein [Acetatifactor muris]
MGAVMNTVYNNYLTTYTPKPLTRFDSHKKSELRNVYNSIVKLNKEEPWYLPTTSKDTQHYAIELKENARGLHNTIAQLGGLEKDGLFRKKSTYSTDEGVAVASYVGGDDVGQEIPDFQLEVHSLAAPQENLGLFLPNNVKTSLTPDTYSFDIGINDMNYEFQFSVGEAETNRDVQDRLVRLINNSDIGIRATLAESEGRTSLRLTSESTGLTSGKNQIFTVSDDHTSKTAGAVEYLGLDYISREPANAQFSVNGAESTSPSNHFTLDKLFEVHLTGLSPDEQPVQIGLKTDVESLTDNVFHLVGGYNDFVKAASSYLETQSKSRQLVRELSGIASVYSSSLEPMGLNLKEDGTLNVDKDTLRQTASQSPDINETFGSLKNFSDMLLRKSNQVSLNPMDYVEKVMVAYKNPGHNFINPYVTSAYTGMMFDVYF